MKMQSSAIARKVWVGTIGGGAASAFVVVLTWYLTTYAGVELPENVQGALVILILSIAPLGSMIGTFLAGYFTPPASRDQIVEK